MPVNRPTKLDPSTPSIFVYLISNKRFSICPLLKIISIISRKPVFLTRRAPPSPPMKVFSIVKTISDKVALKTSLFGSNNQLPKIVQSLEPIPVHIYHTVGELSLPYLITSIIYPNNGFGFFVINFSAISRSKQRSSLAMSQNIILAPLNANDDAEVTKVKSGTIISSSAFRPINQSFLKHQNKSW